MDDHDESQTLSECCHHELMELIDEGHRRLGAGEPEAAAELHRQAVEQAPEHAEVITLGGCIASAQGDYEQALRLFERATRLEPTYFVAHLDAAEVQLDGLGDPEGCLRSCARALELSGDDEIGRFEALMYRAAALLELGRDDEAAAALGRTKGLQVDDPALLERVGRMWLSLGRLRPAELALRAALSLDEHYADAWHSLGAVHEARGRQADMIAAWLEVLALDAAAPPSPLGLSEQAFEDLVRQALAELPPLIQAKLEQVAIVIEELPTETEVQDGLDPRLLGLFCGPPLGQQGVLDAALVEPNCVKLYQRNIEAVACCREHLIEEVRTTLLHETAHFFGLEDDDLAAMGLG